MDTISTKDYLCCIISKQNRKDCINDITLPNIKISYINEIGHVKTRYDTNNDYVDHWMFHVIILDEEYDDLQNISLDNYYDVIIFDYTLKECEVELFSSNLTLKNNYDILLHAENKITSQVFMEEVEVILPLKQLQPNLIHDIDAEEVKIMDNNNCYFHTKNMILPLEINDISETVDCRTTYNDVIITNEDHLIADGVSVITNTDDVEDIVVLHVPQNNFVKIKCNNKDDEDETINQSNDTKHVPLLSTNNWKTKLSMLSLIGTLSLGAIFYYGRRISKP